MAGKKYLESLKWNSFSTYPKQGEDIFLHCYTCEKHVCHRYIELRNFNAVMFNPKAIIKEIGKDRSWNFEWLPIAEVKTES